MKTSVHAHAIMQMAVFTICIYMMATLPTNAQKSFQGFPPVTYDTPKFTDESRKETSLKAVVQVDYYNNQLDFVIDHPVQIEDWMLHHEKWAKSENSYKKNRQNITVSTRLSNNAITDEEDEIAIEEWMYTSDSWK